MPNTYHFNVMGRNKKEEVETEKQVSTIAELVVSHAVSRSQVSCLLAKFCVHDLCQGASAKQHTHYRMHNYIHD